MDNRKELYNDFNQEAYMQTWFRLAHMMEKEGMLWNSLLENDEWNQYMSPSLYTLSKERWNEIILATKQIYNILQKTYRILKEDRDLFVKLGIPYSAWSAAMSETGSSMFSYFTRLDLIVDHGEIKLIEANVDTPTGLVEAAVANRIICSEHKVLDPNHIEEQLALAWTQILHDYGIQSTDKLFYSSYGWHQEDRNTVEFNLKHCPHPEKTYIPINEIVVADNGIFTPAGEQITYLYRLYPLEYLDIDVDRFDKKIGHLFLDHIAEGRVKIINPPSAFLMQSKATLAIIWELYEERSAHFNEDDRDVIQKYFLPTYFSARFFEENSLPYVMKPIWGREGGGVTIVENDVVAEDRTEYYFKQRKVYQKYMEMPDQTIGTWDDVYRGKLLVGSHVIGGEPAGLFLRVGEKITGNLSMFMAVTLED